MRRFAAAVALPALAGMWFVAAPVSPARAVPVATTDPVYAQFGRVFPDPHGCARGAPGTSPWAKGRVCAVQFLQFNDVIAGLGYLQNRFRGLLEVINLHDRLANDPEFAEDELQSAGLPREDLSRDKRDLYVIKVTDRSSPVPEPRRKHFAYSLSIHGIERAGVEGGIRAIEDLVTWAACEKDAAASPSCADEQIAPGSPKRILEAFDPPEGPTAGEVLRGAVVYFVLSNPDGWRRGEASEGGVFFQRYNGNGMDGNRDWPSIGYTHADYTPASEPETRGYGKFLLRERAKTAEKRFDGAIDLHGMLNARSFSYTLLGAGQRDYRKNAITVQTAITTFRDSEARLTWSPLVAKSGQCPGRIPAPIDEESPAPMCTDQWGTVWDTINYQVTGSFGDWMDSPIGLDAVGIDNEMAYSHLAPNNVYDPDLEQLHVDGNKGLIYAQIAALLNEKPVSFTPAGRIAYVYDPARIRNPGGAPAAAAGSLRAQEAIEHTAPDGRVEVPFTVKGLSDGVRNGGLTIEATSGNVRGISPNANASFIVDYCGPPEHIGDGEGECHEVARYFNQSGTYLQAGARIDLNNPRPGPYKIRADEDRVFPVKYVVSFSAAHATPVPDQLPYDVSRMDFFADLNRYAPAAKKLTPVTIEQIVAQPEILDGFDTVVAAGSFMPGFAIPVGTDRGVPPSAGEAPTRTAYLDAISSFVIDGGALVLTDGAMAALPLLHPALKQADVNRGYFYAGWMDFDGGEGPTYARHHLAKGVDMPGTSEGRATLGGIRFDNRHQTYEPVPLGYFVAENGSGNASCNTDVCDSPNWIVDEAAWKRAGGTIAARTYVQFVKDRSAPAQSGAQAGAAPPDPKAGVSLGELKLGKGVVRIAGALFPDPTEDNYHPYGLSSYAPTYTGYQVFENLVRHRNTYRPASVLPRRQELPATGAGGADVFFPALLAALAVAGVGMRTARWRAGR